MNVNMSIEHQNENINMQNLFTGSSVSSSFFPFFSRTIASVTQKMKKKKILFGFELDLNSENALFHRNPIAGLFPSLFTH